MRFSTDLKVTLSKLLRLPHHRVLESITFKATDALEYNYELISQVSAICCT